MSIEELVKQSMVSTAMDLLNKSKDSLVAAVALRPSMAGKSPEEILVEIKASIEADPFGFILFYQKNLQS